MQNFQEAYARFCAIMAGVEAQLVTVTFGKWLFHPFTWTLFIVSVCLDGIKAIAALAKEYTDMTPEDKRLMYVDWMVDHVKFPFGSRSFYGVMYDFGYWLLDWFSGWLASEAPQVSGMSVASAPKRYATCPPYATAGSAVECWSRWQTRMRD